MKLRHVFIALTLSASLAGCGYASTAAPSAPTASAGQPAPILQDPVEQAEVPIAGVDQQAEAVNEGELEQGSGIRMVPDEGRGLDETDVSDTALAGGCVPDYGSDGACLPPVPLRMVGEHAGHAGMSPMEMATLYTCDDVRLILPDGIDVTGEDTLALDSNGDGVACGEGDS